MGPVAGFPLLIDSKGYRLEAAVLAPKHLVVAAPQRGEASPQGPGQKIVRLGGNLHKSGDLEKCASLYEFFAKKAQTAEGALEFVRMHGSITEAGADPQVGDDVKVVTKWAKIMQKILALHTAGEAKKLAAIFNKNIHIAEISACLASDPNSGKLSLRLEVPSLLDGLFLQLGQALSGSANLKLCLYCNDVFTSGRGSGRRLDAKFCSDRHREQYNSELRSKK